MDYKEKVIALLNSQELSREQKEKLENIFPELKEKESEDERIRKALTEFLKSASGGFLNSAIECETFGEWLDWLEKQSEKKSADNVKPRFKVGDWVLNNVCFPVQIASIKDSMYIFTEGDAMSVSFIDENFHLWTIHDAMDGDVLYCKATSGTEFIMVLKNITRYGILNSYCRYNSDDGFDINVPSVMSVRDNPKPATIEQLLKMPPATIDHVLNGGLVFEEELKGGEK